MTTRSEVRARLLSPGEFGVRGSAVSHARYIEPMSGRWRNRRRCRCGCNGKNSHAGRANGVTLTSGCELSVRRWVRDGPGSR